MTEINQNSLLTVENKQNPEREAVKSLIHRFFQERQKNTPTHRLLAESPTSELEEKLNQERKAIARELLNISDEYNEFIDMPFLNYVEDEGGLRMAFSKRETPTGYLETIICFNENDSDVQYMLRVLQDKWNIKDDEWQNLTKLDWSDEEKSKLRLIQDRAKMYQEEAEKTPIHLDGHFFKPSMEEAMRHVLRKAYVTAQYQEQGLPTVHEERATMEIMTGGLEL